MRKIDDIKWKYFEDKKGNKSRNTIFNGGELTRHMTDVYFELKITDDGQLFIAVEDEFFYMKKLDTIYKAIYKKIYELSGKGEYAFYEESTFNYCKIIEKVYSSVENENW